MSETSTRRTSTTPPNASVRYAELAHQTISAIEATQHEVIEHTAMLCTEKIARGGLVHLFGSGHSRIVCAFVKRLDRDAVISLRDELLFGRFSTYLGEKSMLVRLPVRKIARNPALCRA